MRPRASLLLCFLISCSLVLLAESKLQEVVAVDDDDDDDDDDWDDEEDDENYLSKPEIDDDSRIYKNPRNSPSAECPRNEIQATILGQKCLRKCSTDEDCKSKKKKCRCDGLCGMSCIKPERECPEVDVFQYGTLTVTGKFFGDKATYACDQGFHLVGVAERVCRADGHWSASTPTCKKDPKAFCSSPPKVMHAKFNSTPEQTSFDLESTVQYYCDEGYDVVTGFERAKCLLMDGAAAWYGPDLTCEPKSCRSPPEISNGRHAGECYTYNCHISYHCAEGYELVGRSEKVCLSDATWYPKEMPQCVQVASVTCPPPEEPANGTILYTSLAYNSVVSYDCKHGFTRVGHATRRCGADRRWTGQTPTCKEIDCGSPGVLYNGWIDHIEAGTGLGASIIFRCNDHMKLEGNSSSLCQIDGKWRNPLPQCLAPCVVPQIENGNITVASHDHDINNASVVEHGERLSVKCVENYEFASNSTPVVCNNGTWTIVPSCSPARCKQMPKPPKNGMVIAPKTNHGMKAIFLCKDGYELVGGGPFNDSFTVECSYGVWLGDIPHCVELYCPFPGYVQNGKVLLVGNMGVYDYRPYVKKIMNNKQIMYDCDKGYYLSEGPPGATCVGGKWSPRELPTCSLGKHPRIRFNRRRRSIGDNSLKNETAMTAYRKFVDLFCNITQKLLILEMDRSHEQLAHGALRQGNRRNDTRPAHLGHGNRSRSWDEKMFDFLKVAYRKMQRIDSRHADNASNASMHELFNAMSQNLFHVDLSEPRKSGKSRDGFEVKSQREFVKWKREIERFLRFYNKSMRWSEKLRKDAKGKGKGKGRGKNKAKNRKKHNGAGLYNEFHEVIKGYADDRMSLGEVAQGIEGLIGRMNVDKAENGTGLAANEVYPFLRHIMETVWSTLKARHLQPEATVIPSPGVNETTGTTMSSTMTSSTTGSPTTSPTTTTTTTMRSTTTTRSTARSTVMMTTTAKTVTTDKETAPSSTTKSGTSLDNEIPAAETGLPKHRIRRIRNADLTYGQRKLLSSTKLTNVVRILSKVRMASSRSNNQKSPSKTWLGRAKRDPEADETAEDVMYKTNVERLGVSQNNQ